ncbi:cilia- and flagella-associated protein 263 isoform X1 [Centroberyx gerrardi]
MEDELSEMEEKSKEVTQEEKELLYKLQRSNASLQAEIDMLDRFINRLDPWDLAPQPAGEGQGGAGASQLEVGGCGRRQRSQSNVSDHFHQMALEQKCYVAQREVEETQGDLEKLKFKSERNQGNYKASLEEAEMCLAEIRRAKNEFERDIAKPLRENKGGMMGPEKVLRYLNDKIKAKDTQVQKLHLKNQALKAQAKKLQLQLRQQKEREDILNEANFKQHPGQSDDQNMDPLQVKKQADIAQQMLSSYKKKLQSVTCEFQQLSSDITKRKEMLAKIEAETRHAEEECSKAAALNQNLQSRLTEYQVPDVLDYIQVKVKHKKLQHSVQSWERKAEIAKSALQSHTKDWYKQRAALAAANNAEPGDRTGAWQPPVKLPNIPEP